MNDLVEIAKTVGTYGGAAIATFAVLKGTFFTVAQQQEGLVSRFGKYTGSPKTPGLRVKIPLIDQVDQRISMALQEISANLDTKTKDDQFVTLPISIQFSVRDSAKYYYDTTNPNQQIKDIVTAEVRKYTSKKDFQELYDERQEISDDVIKTVTEELQDYGIDVTRVVIDEPQPDEATKQAYNDVRASERRKDAASNDAQADYIKEVRSAEADAKRSELIGEGTKAFRKSVAESYIETREALIEAGVDEVAADKFMVEAMRLDTLRDVGDKGNVIVMALENSSAGEQVPSLLAALKATQAEEQDNKPRKAPDVIIPEATAPKPE